MRRFHQSSVKLFLLFTVILALCGSSRITVFSADASTPASTRSNGLPYFLLVNRQANTVTVYTLDENGYYSVPMKAMICSTGRSGHATPLFDTTLPGWKKRWCYMVDGSYGQYATEINGNYLFHSVCYYQSSSDALMNYEYNALGSYASLGCVRLQVKDAKWIYDNCDAGTRVAIYDSPDPGPLGKPNRVVNQLPDGSGWEPTDPAYGNPWNPVEVQTDAAGGGAVSGGGTYHEGDPVTVYATPDSGMRFAGWYLSGGGLLSTEAVYTFPMEGAVTLLARFVPQYQLTTPIIGEGTVTRTEDFSSGYQLHLTAAANPGSRFVGWFEGDSLISSSPSLSLELTGDRTITARFEKFVTVSVQASCSGSVTGAGDYSPGASVTLTAVPADGQAFEGWYDQDGALVSTENPYSLQPVESTRLIAMFAGDGFLDIQGSDWFRDPVYRARQLGLVNGTAPFTYEPNLAFSRSMAAAMLSRIDGEAIEDSEVPFLDVPAGAWYAGAVSWAYDNGVIQGTSEGTFSPDDPVSRQDFFTMTARFLTVRNYACDGGELPFHDSGEISDYAEEPIRQLLAIGLIQGNDSGYIHPRDTMTRAEGAAVLVRLWDYMQANAPAPTPEADFIEGSPDDGAPS